MTLALTIAGCLLSAIATVTLGLILLRRYLGTPDDACGEGREGGGVHSLGDML